MRFMKRVLVFCLISMIMLAVVAIVFQCVTGEELSPTLIQWYYSVFGVELGALALLKIAEITDFKLKKKKPQTDDPPAVEEGDENNVGNP